MVRGLPGRQPGPWPSAEPARLLLTCVCLPVSLPSFINAAICGIKIPSYLHLAAGGRERGEGVMGAKGSWLGPGPKVEMLSAMDRC